MKIVLAGTVDRDVQDNFLKIRKIIGPFLEEISKLGDIGNLDIKIIYAPIIVNPKISSDYPENKKINRSKKTYNCEIYLNYIVFLSGSWREMVNVYLDGIRSCAARFPEFGATQAQISAFLNMLKQIGDRFSEEPTQLVEAQKPDSAAPAPLLLTKEELAESFIAMQRKDAQVDRSIMKTEDALARVEGLRKNAETKTYLGDKWGDEAPLYYRNYRSSNLSEDFVALGPALKDTALCALQEAAHKKVARLSAKFDLDPDATLARFSTEFVSIGLGQDFRNTELKERAERRARRGEKPETKKKANGEIDKFHQQVREIYQFARSKIWN